MKATLITLLLLLSHVGVALSAVVMEQSVSPLTGAIISNPLIDGGTAANTSAYYRLNPNVGDTPYRSAGQAFKVEESFSMKSVTWQILAFAAGVPGKAFTIDIYEVAGLASTNAPSGPPLSRQAGVLPATLDPTKPYYTFTLEEPVDLIGGKFYAVIFSFTEPTSTTSAVGHLQFVTVGVSNSVLSPAPRRWLDEGGTWATISRNQQVFYVHAVPEPSVTLLSLGVMAAGGAALRSFKRNR